MAVGGPKILFHPCCLPWNNITALLHKRAYSEPERVVETELIDQDLLLVAGVGVVPLIGAEPAHTGLGSAHTVALPGQDEEQDRDKQIGKEHADPNPQGERVHEGE